jgi:hypothetical protein
VDLRAANKLKIDGENVAIFNNDELARDMNLPETPMSKQAR